MRYGATDMIITNHLARHAFLALIAVHAFLAIASEALAAEPSPPAALRAEVYSRTTAELFWDRPDVFSLRYEVRRDDAILTTTDGVSFFDDTLAAGTAYTYTVIAIDRDGQRSAASTVQLETRGGTTAGIPAPTGLRAEVYSGTAAELFWDRFDDSGLRFEVRRDGNVVSTSDGISYFDDTLARGRDYAYQIIAIDSAGKRSAPASVTVRTDSSSEPSDPGQPMQPDPPDDTLTAIQPKDLTIKVYSSTAAELFWTPPDRAFRPVVEKNEIRRNGMLIATVPGWNLRSYFDSNREPGKSYAYTVTAISSAGQASATVSDTGVSQPQPTEPPSTTTPPSDLPGPVRAKLDMTFEIIDAAAIEKVMATIARLADRDFRASAGFTATGQVEMPGLGWFDVFACPNGGELLESLGEDELGNIVQSSGRFSNRFDATNCAIGPIVFTGLMSHEGLPSGFEPDGVVRSGSVNAIGIVLDDSRDLSTISFDQAFYFPDETDLRFSRYSAYDITVEWPEYSWSAESVHSNGRDRQNQLPDGGYGMTARARNVVGPFSGSATMNTLGPMEYDNGRDSAHPTAGRLEFGTASDRLLIDAFNGDPATFTLTVTTDSTTTSYTVPFSDTYRFEAPVTAGLNIGF